MGKRVVGEINAVCHLCWACENGRTAHCENRTVLGIVNRNGAFAEYLSLPSENLYEVPSQIPDDFVVFTEPLAAALEIQEQVHIQKRDLVLIVGDGKLGLLIAQTLFHTGCTLHIMGKHEKKLQLLSDFDILTLKPEDLEERSYDFSIECTGNPEGFLLARKALRPRGTLIMKSTYSSHLNIDASSLVVDEISLVGSRCGPFPKALKMLSEENINLSPMVHHRFPIEQGLKAFEEAQKPGVLKVIVEFK